MYVSSGQNTRKIFGFKRSEVHHTETPVTAEPLLNIQAPLRRKNPYRIKHAILPFLRRIGYSLA